MDSGIEGPAWAQQGLDQREGRYPLAVEAPVLSMVATLMPGVSTLTQFARYYSLYWALADVSETHQWDAPTCQRVLRRSELLLAVISEQSDVGMVKAHGVDAVQRERGAGKQLWELAELGKGSYSPRAWGFWSQYGGPSDALGTASTEDGALRASRHACPQAVRQMFAPLLEIAASGQHSDLSTTELSELQPLALSAQNTPDAVALGELMTATRSGQHEPADWTGNDRTRRSTLRILARALQLEPDADTWLDAMRCSVAYGAAADEDPVLASEDRTPAWRGLLLRHRSVGAWRRLWAGLVDHVREQGVTTHANLHDWIADRLPDHGLGQFVDDLPAIEVDGNPAPAEDALPEDLGLVYVDTATLVMGAQRRNRLSGPAQIAFLRGSRPGRGTFLDPIWVGRRVEDHVDHSVRDLGRVLVDDMLSQARRVALGKVNVRDGRLQLFSRLHERNGTYTARAREGSGNVGLRIDQLGGIAEQIGLIDAIGASPLTALGSGLLELPA